MRIKNKFWKEIWFSLQEFFAEPDEVTTINPEQDVTAIAIGCGFLFAVFIFIYMIL